MNLEDRIWIYSHYIHTLYIDKNLSLPDLAKLYKAIGMHGSLQRYKGWSFLEPHHKQTHTPTHHTHYWKSSNMIKNLFCWKMSDIIRLHVHPAHVYGKE